MWVNQKKFFGKIFYLYIKEFKMKRILRLSESQLKKIIRDIINEAPPSDFAYFQTNDTLSQLRNALDSNKMVSVAYVKKDGTVRHMVLRKYLSSYVPSDAPKTEKQLNVQQNNDIKRVVDVNVYNKSLKELRGQGMGDEDAKAEASKKCWRTINLKEVLGFLVSGRFVDLRQENDIMERYGEEIYNSLTKNMVRAMADDMQNDIEE